MSWEKNSKGAVLKGYNKNNMLVLTLDPVFKDKMILGTIEEF